MPISLDSGYANLFMNLAMRLKHFLGAQSSGYPVLGRREQQEVWLSPRIPFAATTCCGRTEIRDRIGCPPL